MVVEDEALVAIMMADTLTELGYFVEGPFSRATDAMAALRHVEVDAALLDINVGGEMVYPLADALVAQGVPIVFVTGYGAESIERRFINVPILQKPIERHTLEGIFASPERNHAVAELDRPVAK